MRDIQSISFFEWTLIVAQIGFALLVVHYLWDQRQIDRRRRERNNAEHKSMSARMTSVEDEQREDRK
jgi:FtsZ-interacting cell division protein ZipA